jgi:hypothetical protein
VLPVVGTSPSTSPTTALTTTHPTTQSADDDLRRLNLALARENTALKEEVSRLQLEVALLKPNRAATKPTTQTADGSDLAKQITEKMARPDVYRIMGRKPDRITNDSKLGLSASWDFDRFERIRERKGSITDYQGEQTDLRNIDTSGPTYGRIRRTTVTVRFDKANKVIDVVKTP